MKSSEDPMPAAGRAANGPVIPRTRLDGVALPISRMVIGCDNRDSLEAGAPVWDAWMAAGGNAFDTAFVYGAGRHEAVLGQWIAARGVAAEIVVIVKGAHPPHCTPEAIAGQLDASLDRLGLDRAPVYILHRDNPEVPVGEFVDALNRLHDAGRIGVFGGSNWTVARFTEANALAAARGLQPMRILNNNLSLAVMQRPVWAGCLASNDPETLAWLRATGTAHLAWSSQARGFFLPAEARSRLSDDTGPEACFGGAANEERRRRAEVLAARYGVSAHNIATAWVLAQAFPSFAIVGPRTPQEIASTLPGLEVPLTPAEVAWLNFEADDLA